MKSKRKSRNRIQTQTFSFGADDDVADEKDADWRFCGKNDAELIVLSLRWNDTKFTWFSSLSLRHVLTTVIRCSLLDTNYKVYTKVIVSLRSVFSPYFRNVFAVTPLSAEMCRDESAWQTSLWLLIECFSLRHNFVVLWFQLEMQKESKW